MPMPTNNEIIRKYDLAGNGELGIDVYDALDEARADTAKQIFSEIDKIINMPQSEITANHNMGTEYLSLKKEFNKEA